MCGEMGWAPESFYGLLYCELALVLEGYAERRKAEAAIRKSERQWLGAVMAAALTHNGEALSALLSDGKRAKAAPADAWKSTDDTEAARQAVARMLGRPAEGVGDGAKQ